MKVCVCFAVYYLFAFLQLPCHGQFIFLRTSCAGMCDTLKCNIVGTELFHQSFSITTRVPLYLVCKVIVSICN